MQKFDLINHHLAPDVRELITKKLLANIHNWDEEAVLEYAKDHYLGNLKSYSDQELLEEVEAWEIEL